MLRLKLVEKSTCVWYRYTAQTSLHQLDFMERTNRTVQKVEDDELVNLSGSAGVQRGGRTGQPPRASKAGGIQRVKLQKL